MARVRLASIGKKNLIVGNINAALAEHALGNGRARKLVTSRRSIALKAIANSQIFCAFTQRRHGHFWKRLGDVANAAANHLQRKLWIGVAKHLHTPRDFREQIPRA